MKSTRLLRNQAPIGPANAFQAETTTMPSVEIARSLLLWCATFFALGLVSIIVWRPFKGAPTTHNTLVLLSLTGECLALSITTCLIRTRREWSIFVIHAVIIGFLVRSIPVLLLSHPPLHDGYFYYASLIDLVDTQSFKPVMQDWYPDVGRQLHWPVLQLLTYQIHLWSGAQLDDLWRFLPPATGSLTVVTIGLIAYQAYQSWRIAAIAGLIGSLSDLVLYYQAEYHPQGIAILLATFLIYMIFASRASQRLGIRMLTILVCAAFLFSHHASSLVLPFLLTPLLVVPLLLKLSRRLATTIDENHRWALPWKRLQAEAHRLSMFNSVVVLLVVAALTLQIYRSNDIMNLAVRSLDPIFWGKSNTGETVELVWWFSLLRMSKYLMLVLGGIGIVFAIRRSSISSIILLVLTMTLFLGGIAGTVVMKDASARFLALWFPFTAIPAAVALDHLIETSGRWRFHAAAIAVLVSAVYLAANILNAQTPAYFLDQTPRSAGVWYGNRLPRTDRLAMTGLWLRDHTSTQSRYAVDFSTRMVPFFFSGRPERQLIYKQTDQAAYCRADYLVIDYSLEDSNFMSPLVGIDRSGYARVYDNGSIGVYQRLPDSPCRELLP
jgi:hypothetical protein